jgi:hypothetical protein
MTTRPLRDALVLDGNPDRIPWLFTASFVIFLAIAPLWGVAVRKSPRRVVPASFHVFAIGSLALRVARASSRRHACDAVRVLHLGWRL